MADEKREPSDQVGMERRVLNVLQGSRVEAGRSGAPIPRRMARSYAALVGVMDFTTGLGLVLVPAVTLGWMGVDVPGVDALRFVRFVGAFVAAVGASYGVALLREEEAALRAAFEWTLLVRASVAAFLGAAVTCGLFERQWMVVALTDLACAIAQAWFLWKGIERDG